MIEWFTWVQAAIATVAGLICVISGLARRLPNDLTLGSTALVEVLLIVQLVVAIASPAFGNIPSGSVPEFTIYLVSALLIPPLAGVWALVQRDRWSTVILGVVCLTVAVMLYRMNVIWFVQVA